MKSERRHELQQNDLAKHVEQWIVRARPYGTYLVGVPLALVVIGIAWTIYQGGASRQAAEASTEYQNAYVSAQQALRRGTLSVEIVEELKGIATNHQNTPAAILAQFSLANMQRRSGTEQAARNPQDSNDLLQQATELYGNVLSSIDEVAGIDAARRAEIKVAATYFRGLAFEAHRDLDRARTDYGGVSEMAPDSALAKQAEIRLADLKQQDVVDFYAWLDGYTPTSSAASQGLDDLDESRLDEDLPGESDFTLPESIEEFSFGGESPFPGDETSSDVGDKKEDATGDEKDKKKPADKKTDKQDIDAKGADKKAGTQPTKPAKDDAKKSGVEKTPDKKKPEEKKPAKKSPDK